MSNSKRVSLSNKREMKVALYCRVAREDNTAIEGQAHIIREYAKKHGYDNPVLYSDNGVSGIGFDRPALGCLSADILAGHIKAVIVKDLSRLSRNPLEISDWINGIRRCGVLFISVQDGITDDHFDKKDEMFRMYSEYLEKLKNK